MLSKEEQSRYSKQIILPEIGTAGQELLGAARVLVVGAGGLGCPILQYLTAAGIGTIGIADGDNIEISNLQRQVLYTTEEIGQKKAEVAGRKLKTLNPNVAFNIHPVVIDSSNALEILSSYDLVVDGSDNFPTRYLLNDACVMQGKPMVFGAIYKFEGQVSVFNYKGGPTYRCIFPESPAADESPNCGEIGVVATLPGIIGTIQANEVIKIITGIGTVLSGKLLVIDTLTMAIHTFNFKLNDANLDIKQLQDTTQQCAPQIREINYEQLQDMLLNEGYLQLVDVRETEEHAMGNIGGLNIPLSVFDASIQLLDRKNTIIVYCNSGIRSNHAAKLLLQRGFYRVLNLENGVNQIIEF